MSGQTSYNNSEENKSGPGGSSTGALIGINRLEYTLEPDLSVAVNVTTKEHQAQQQDYGPNSRTILILNSGADYIDARRSTLDFTLTNNHTAPIAFSSAGTTGFGTQGLAGPEYEGAGSVLNLIERITVTSRSGDELARVRGSNLYNASCMPYKYDRHWFNTVGSRIGWQDVLAKTGGLDTVETRAIDGSDQSVKHYSIPLYLLCPFFQYERLLPAMLMSGLRIEIEWADPASSLIALDKVNFQTEQVVENSAAAALPSNCWTINNLRLRAKSIQLTDAAQRALNEQSAVNGLEIVYTDIETTEQSIGTDSTAHVEVRKASSRALNAFAVVRYNDLLKLPAKAKFEPADWRVIKCQWQLGSLFFPHQPISGTTQQTAQKAFQEAQDMFECYKRTGKRSLVGYEDFLGITPLVPSHSPAGAEAPAGATDTYTALEDIRYVSPHGSGVLAVQLERSSLFKLSGVPINNSRILALDVDFADKPTNATSYHPHTRSIAVFMQYVKLARVFLNNVEVEQ